MGLSFRMVIDGHHPDPADGVGDNSNYGDGHGAQSSGALQAIAWSLGGFLLPGCPQLGSLRWRGRLYLCSTAERAEQVPGGGDHPVAQFGSDPDLFLSGVEALVHRHPVLQGLLCPEVEEVAQER